MGARKIFFQGGENMESGQNYEGVWETYVPQLGPEAEHR